MNIFFTFLNPQIPSRRNGGSRNGPPVQFSSTPRSSPRSSAQQQEKRQWQKHKQMSHVVTRHKDCHCSSNLDAFMHCPAHPPEVVDSLCWKQRFETKGMGHGNLLPFSCDWVLCGKCTPPSLSENQREPNSQCCCSRGDLHCQVDLWCIWVDRLPWAREEVGLQRKEGRRLNLHQNVWLPTAGKGRGSGGGWKLKRQMRKLHYQIGKRWRNFKVSTCKISGFPAASSPKLRSSSTKYQRLSPKSESSGAPWEKF